MGIHRLGKLPHISGGGEGISGSYNENLYSWFRELSERLRYVRVVCGDWTRVCGGDWQDRLGVVGIFFDPPYSHDVGRCNELYHVEDDVSAAVRAWCIGRQDRPTHRIVLAGYDTEHAELEGRGWRVIEWRARGGYANLGNGDGKPNRHRERLWLSPHCVGAQQTRLFV